MVRMTYSSALALFRDAKPVTSMTLTSRHIDMVQMMDIGIDVRASLGPADDDIKAGRRPTAATSIVVEAYNDLVRKHGAP